MSLGIRNFAERKTAGTDNHLTDISNILMPEGEEPEAIILRSVNSADELSGGEKGSFKI